MNLHIILGVRVAVCMHKYEFIARPALISRQSNKQGYDKKKRKKERITFSNIHLYL